MENHSGSCHCGAIRFEVETDLSDTVRCNCSFCVRRGALLQRVPADRFRLIEGEDVLGKYGSRDFSDHFFCSNCGIHAFSRSTRTGQDSVVVNVACLEGVDPDAFTPRIFDGANLL